MTNKRRFIPVASPVFAGNEKSYVADCLDTGWISAGGDYVGRFESAFAEFCGVRHAVACCNGTVALHLALMALGVKAQDEVIIPTLTFVATANAVTYCGAQPVFVDSEPRTWNIDPAAIERHITPRTRGIIAVHLYGHPADMDAIKAIAERYHLLVIEDAAEAHGAEYKGRRAGSLSDMATFSFYGNKIIATGEGGMVVTDDARLAERARLLRGQGMDPERRYWFPIIGYNYRMMNIPAAIGLAQLEQVDWHIARRLEVAAWYREELQELPGINWQTTPEWGRHVYWMWTVLMDKKTEQERDQITKRLWQRGIETRPVFYPVHSLPPYRDPTQSESYPVAEQISRCGISLPTWAGLTYSDVRYICRNLRECLAEPSGLVASVESHHTEA
ncbi:MAG: DegT/DnrJ/EryC1/StrS family aminotransferase [Acidobacteriota bacterium]|nr:DegT/DnrJ/EryC1/StrS family aminotransferase [Acidobacteriota bacterium]